MLKLLVDDPLPPFPFCQDADDRPRHVEQAKFQELVIKESAVVLGTQEHMRQADDRDSYGHSNTAPKTEPESPQENGKIVESSQQLLQESLVQGR
jgi:hypothetical protein